MGRIGRACRRAAAAPLAAIVGVAVLPALHLAMRGGLVQSTQVISKVRRQTPEPTTQVTANDLVRAREIADGVHLGARLWRLQKSSCVARALCTWTLCRQRGVSAEVRIGFDPAKRKAHAWVEVDSEPVDDTADVRERYLVFDGALSDRASGGYK